MNNEPYELSINDFRLKLNGNSCEECRPICQAICCRFPWRVYLTREEFLTGKYEAQQKCSFSGEDCTEVNKNCQYRVYQLLKKSDNSCMYLDEFGLCTIHSFRPNVCREWTCSYSLSLSPKKEEITNKISTHLEKEQENFNDEDIFILNPVFDLNGIIYQPDQSKLYFIKQKLGCCDKYFSDEVINVNYKDEEQINSIISLFTNKQPMKTIKTEFQSILGEILTIEDLNELVTILIKHNVIVNIKYFFGIMRRI